MIPLSEITALHMLRAAEVGICCHKADPVQV